MLQTDLSRASASNKFNRQTGCQSRNLRRARCAVSDTRRIHLQPLPRAQKSDLYAVCIKVRIPLCNRLMHDPNPEEAAFEGHPITRGDLHRVAASLRPQGRTPLSNKAAPSAAASRPAASHHRLSSNVQGSHRHSASAPWHGQPAPHGRRRPTAAFDDDEIAHAGGGRLDLRFRRLACLQLRPCPSWNLIRREPLRLLWWWSAASGDCGAGSARSGAARPCVRASRSPVAVSAEVSWTCAVPLEEVVARLVEGNVLGGMRQVAIKSAAGAGKSTAAGSSSRRVATLCARSSYANASSVPRKALRES